MKLNVIMIILLVVAIATVSAAVLTGGKYTLGVAPPNTIMGEVSGGPYELKYIIGERVEGAILKGGPYEFCTGFMCTIKDDSRLGRKCPYSMHWDRDLFLSDPDSFWLSPVCTENQEDIADCPNANDCVYDGKCYTADRDSETVEETINGNPASCFEGKWCPQYFETAQYGNKFYCKWKYDDLCFNQPCVHEQLENEWFDNKPSCCSPGGRKACCVKKVWDGVYYYTMSEIKIY